MTKTEQSARFEKAMQELIDAGELDPTEADKQFDRLMDKLRPTKTAD